MFERYTEKARRAIFFARYEASQHGLAEIDTRCLQLGILRAAQDMMPRLLASGSEELARLSADTEALFTQTGEEIAAAQKVATNVDMPVSQAARRALAYAAEESARLHHKSIDPRHLLLGLLRENGPEAACWKAHGVGPEEVQTDFVRGGKIDDPGAPPTPGVR